jgi:hypothetical protein
MGEGKKLMADSFTDGKEIAMLPSVARNDKLLLQGKAQ